MMIKGTVTGNGRKRVTTYEMGGREALIADMPSGALMVAMYDEADRHETEILPCRRDAVARVATFLGVR